jgi:hypothetical protein
MRDLGIAMPEVSCCIVVQAPYSTQPPEGSDRLTNLGSSVNEPGSSAAREGTEALPDQATASKSAEAKPGDAAPDAAHEIASGQMPAAAAARGDGEGDVYYDALDGAQRSKIPTTDNGHVVCVTEPPRSVSVLLT